MRAVVVACPTEELLYFAATLSVFPPSEILLLSVLQSPPGEEERDYSEGFYSLCAERGHRSEMLRYKADVDGRLLPEPLSELLRGLLQRYEVGDVYTYAIQGDKGKRYRADVAMAVWLATNGKGSHFLAKHTIRVTDLLKMQPEKIVHIYDFLVRHYSVGISITDASINHIDVYTSHTAEEAKVAYYEISHGLEGVRRLTGEGDADPWGYRSSSYAEGRAIDTLRLVKSALRTSRSGTVWEVGPASGHITERLLCLPELTHISVIERFEEFRQCLVHHVGPTEKLTVRQDDMREIRFWDCDVAILVDCLDFYLSDEDQLEVVLRALTSGAQVVVGGEAVWASSFIKRLTERGSVATREHITRSGAFEPMRLGFSVHCPKPPWAAYLLDRSN
ncbi:MAG TPA: hypothetical protein VJR02_16830 [Pyrinomonadaceae bacterium]|nr:hypothetical protein [Pyrinomonadaceae bacterium]